MKQQLRRVLRKTAVYHALRDRAVGRAQARALAQWKQSGQPVPPPHIVKQETLRAFARDYGLRTLVETGTCYGDMVRAMSRDFDRIYSIELSAELYEAARRRFSREPHIELIHGDSAVEIGRLVEKLDGPALFWLDGHYSGGDTAKGEKETPVLEELSHILARAAYRDVLIIDDARLFGDDPAYPTLASLRDFVAARRPDLELHEADDMIRITPARP